MEPVFSEVDLLNGMINNHYSAFKQYYSDNRFTFIFFTDRRLKDWPESEIIVDDVFLKIWEMRTDDKKTKFDSLRDLRNYIYTACFNAVSNRHRVKKKEFPVADPVSYFETIATEDSKETLELAILEAELLKKVYNEIDRLTPDRRKILKFYLDGLDTAKIAKEMGMSEVAVRNAKFKGLQVLRKKLLPGELVLLFSVMNLTDKTNHERNVISEENDAVVSKFRPLENDAPHKRTFLESKFKLRL